MRRPLAKLMCVWCCLLAPTAAICGDDSFPIYDVNSHCQNASSEWPTPTAQALTNKCISDEQTSYDILKGIWPSLPQPIKEKVLAFYSYEVEHPPLLIYTPTLEYEGNIEAWYRQTHPDEYKQPFHP